MKKKNFEEYCNNALSSQHHPLSAKIGYIFYILDISEVSEFNGYKMRTGFEEYGLCGVRHQYAIDLLEKN